MLEKRLKSRHFAPLFGTPGAPSEWEVSIGKSFQRQ
jgi:hypothetical protein